LDAWALDELVGHYVNYRKLLAVGGDDRGDVEGDDTEPERLLPEHAFQLYAVATREPLGLFRRLPPGALQPTDHAGVHDLHWGCPP
jgi:hypothetical protein